MLGMKFSLDIAVFIILWCCVLGQEWGAWSNQGPVTGDMKFYMDSASQCSGKVFNVGQTTSTIYGRGVVQASPSAITECTIILKSDEVREKKKFMVEISVGYVNDKGAVFTMYDGQGTGGNRLFTIGKGTTVDKTKRYVTSGGFVTFYFKKNSPADADYSIQIIARVIPGDITSQEECVTGNEYGCSYYGYTTPVDKETIIGIVGGVFGLIMFIIIPIIIIYCYRKSQGVTKKWDEFNLRETNTAADIHNSSASLTTKSKKDPWTSKSSRALSDYNKSYATRSRYSDDGSVFSDGTDLPPKSRPPPPPYDEYDRGRSYRDGPRRFGRDDRFNRNDGYDDRSERDYRSDRDYRSEKDYRSERSYRPRYDSDRREPSQKSYVSSDDASFVQARDDHPQDVFVERVIEPRVKPLSKAEKQQRAKYEDDEDPYDKIVDESPKLKIKEKVKESAMQCGEESSDDNESNTENDDNPSTDESDEDDVIKKKEADKAALYAKPSKKSKKSKPEQVSGHLPQVAQVPQVAYPVQPGGVNMLPPRPLIFTAPNGAQIFPRPPQAVFGQLPQVRPMMAVPGYPQPVPMSQPRYTQSAPVPQAVQIQPPMYQSTQPPQQPVFTHLVQRGYGRQSPSLDGSEGRNQRDDSGMSANLDSGVEFMKRTTTTV